MSNAMGAPLNFNAANVAPDEGRMTVPPGWYNTVISKSEMKPTSTGNGSYLQLELTILDGEHKGRKLFDRMNLNNPSATAVEIAQKRLSAYCHATNVINVSNSMQLHNIPFKVKVKLKPAEGQYDESNEITAVKALDSTDAAPVAQAGGAAGGAPAWLAAPAAAPAAAAPAATVAAPAPAPAPVKKMTALANGATYEQFVANGWKDDAMIAQGYMVLETPAATPAPTAPTPTTSAPPPWQTT